MRETPRHTRAALLAFGVLLAPVQALELSASPELPRLYVDTTYVPPSGRTITVLSGEDFQAALDTALPGDVITLQAGATFTGPFTLPETTGTGWIVVRSSAPDSSLPVPGSRVKASHAPLLPKIVSPDSGPALATAPRAHHFRFIGIEFTVAANVTRNYGLVQLGSASSSQSSLTDVPHHLIFDRVYIHGNPNVDLRRGIGLNSAWTAVIDSSISGVHEVGADSQAIAGWNGPGPFKIVNCYLEGAGENVLFGGADPSIVNLVPSDIEIRENHFYKPLSWRIGDPSYAGKPWSVKNLFELKNARRVLADGNVFENNWLHSQSGFAILFTPRNQDGNAPWSVVEDVTFTRNIVRHTGAGVNILGSDDIFTSQQTKRVLIKDNFFEDVSGAKWGGTGRLFQILAGTAETVIDHNTAFHTGDVIAAAGQPHTGFVYRNNLTAHNQYGVGGDGAYGNPLLALATYFPGALFLKNLLMGGNALNYPPLNYFPASWQSVGFVDFSLGNYRLSAASPYRLLGTDAKDIGADIDALIAATAGAVGGGGTYPADTTPPSVSLTSPASGAVLSGVVTTASSASDNVGVASVEFKADGVGIGFDSVAPYAASWDTRTVANGQHTLTAVARDGAGNTASASVAVNVANGVAQSPYPGQPFPAPGVIQAEDFDIGGEGVAYHDLVPGNQGGLYRTNEGVDIIAPYPGGYAVNGFQTSEWLEYTIAVSQSGIYRLEALASSMFTSSSFRMEIDGANVTGPVSVPNTGGWKTFGWVGKGGVSLASGTHVLRLYSEAEYFNVDALRVTADTAATLAWTQMVNVTATGSVLQKTAGCDGCPDAGAVSVSRIASGDLYMELIASETSTLRAVGLSRGNTNTKVSDIDFAVQFWPGGGVEVRENGVYRADTTYASGNVFRIAVESGVVKYYKNGALFYTSAKALVYPLRVDTSLQSAGATLKNVSLRTGR